MAVLKSTPVLSTNLLKSVGVFGGLPESALDLLERRLRVDEYAPGDAVYECGDVGRELFVVITGRVNLEASGGEVEEPRLLGSVGPGGTFGEMSVVDLQPRIARARCVEPFAHAANLTRCLLKILRSFTTY